jgi:hypothetical protein
MTLAEAFARDAERMARFRREAKVPAALRRNLNRNLASEVCRCLKRF